MSNSLWMYIDNGKPVGPVSEQELFRLIEEGKLSSHDLVAQKGDRSWISIKEHPKLQKKDVSALHKKDPIDKHWVLLLKRPPHRGGGFTQKGPFDKEELIAMVKSGDAAFTDYAWRPGYKKWTKITDTEMFSTGQTDTSFEVEEGLPEIPKQSEELLSNVVVQQKNKSNEPESVDENDLVQSYEAEKQLSSTPPVPKLEQKTSVPQMPDLPQMDNDDASDENQQSSDEFDDESSKDFNENQAPIINTTTQAFKEFEEGTKANKQRKSKRRKKRRKKTLFEKIFNVSTSSKIKKRKRSHSRKKSNPAIEDFKSWRDEEAFLKAARRKQIQKSILQFSLLGGFGLALFGVSLILILNFFGSNKQAPTVNKPSVQSEVVAVDSKPAVTPQSLLRPASTLRVSYNKDFLIFNFDQFKNPTMNLQIISNPKKSLLPLGFYYQNMVQVSGMEYRFPLADFAAGEYFIKAQLDEQQVEQRFEVKSEKLKENSLEWAKKRKSKDANKEKFLAVEISRKLYYLAKELEASKKISSNSWSKFYNKWSTEVKKSFPLVVSSNLSKINGPNKIIYINYWLEYQSMHEKLEQFGQLMKSQGGKLSQSVDIDAYKSLYESARTLSQW